MYSLRTKVVGNPDYRQPKKLGIKNVTLKAPTLEELQDLVSGWQWSNDIGSGNWCIAKVIKDKKTIGWMSYNGRIMDKEDGNI